MIITSAGEIDESKSLILQAAKLAQDSLSHQSNDPLSWMRDIKFSQIGFHPETHKPLNLIEQVNQTFTDLVALEATRTLLLRHPGAEGFHLAPGAYAHKPFDIVSVKSGLVGAECFATVDLKNNNKLKKDLEKLKGASEQHRYVFFSSPEHLTTEHVVALDRWGVEVWSIAL